MLPIYLTLEEGIRAIKNIDGFSSTSSFLDLFKKM